MNTTESTSTVDPAFAAWAAQMRALRAERGQPILDDADPRFAELAERVVRMDLPAEDLGARYFETLPPETYPSCPLASPAWATQRDAVPEANDWPLIGIVDASAVVEVGHFGARLMRYGSVIVDELPDDWNIAPDGQQLDGTCPKFGELVVRETIVEIYNFETRNHAVLDLDLAEAPSLLEALQAVLALANPNA